MPHLNLDMIKGMLRDQGESMLRLADKLDDDAKGRKLNPQELELMRIACIPAVKESADLILSAFILNSTDWLETEKERFEELLDMNKMI